MTVNYFIECPICKTITRMRSPAGYIYSTPVRIHCGNCNTLLIGEFISDEKRAKAYFIGKNCKEVQQQDYSYYGETSGEILSKKIVPFNGTKAHLFHPTPSPVFDNFSLMDLNEMDSFIDYSCYVSNLSSKWDYIICFFIILVMCFCFNQNRLNFVDEVLKINNAGDII